MEMQHGTPQGELARFDSAIDNIFLPAALGPGDNERGRHHGCHVKPSRPFCSARRWRAAARSRPHPLAGDDPQFRNLSGDPSRGLQVDGIFGPRTEEAVRGFQQALSLDVPSVAVDGIVGPITWRALVSGM